MIAVIEQKFQVVKEWIAGFVSGRPWLALLAGFILLAAAVAGLPRVQVDFTHRGFFYPTDPELVKFDEFERKFGNDDVAVIAIDTKNGVFNVETAKAIQQVTARM